LTQIVLAQEDAELAQRMTNIYFALFKELISKNEVEAKLLDLILSGVHRAFPYAKFEDSL
jgi:ribosome biogenesis protein MAK21